MNVPKLRFNEFNYDWGIYKIKDFYDFKNGLNKEKEFFGKGTPIVNYMDVNKNRHIYSTDIKGLVTLSDKEIENYNVKKNDLFFTRTSETAQEIGLCAAMLDDIQDCAFSGFVLRARPKNNDIIAKFASYCFSTSSVREEIIKKSSITTRALTSGTSLNEVIVKIPMVDEQQKIADFLSLVDRKIELQEKKTALLKDYKKGVVEKVKSNEYVQVQLKTLCSQISSNRTLSSTENLSGDFPIYDSNGVLTFIDNYDIETEYISIIKDGAGVGRLNKCKKKSSVIATLSALVPSSCTVDYLYLVLEMINFKKYITGSTIPHIYFKDYSNEYVPFPNIQTQYDLSRMNSLMLKKIQKSEMCIEQIKQLKSSLLQQMFI